MTVRAESFSLRIAEEALADLRERLARTRFPDQAPGAPWAYGTDVDWLRGLVAYWRDRFDWRAAEARLNAFPQYVAPVGGVDLHFLHVPGRGPAPVPLLLAHGWPGSVMEFLDIVPRLADPARFGGDARDAVTVIAPSLPGYGLSFKAGQKRFGVEEIADCLAALMRDVIGCERFAVQGGDWGAFVAARLGHVCPERVIGVHLNMMPIRRDRAIAADPTPAEAAYFDDMEEWLREETGYQWIQGTRPQTLAFGLTDSPAGLAAWIAEKFRAWSDCGGDVDSVFEKDRLLANVGLYWFHRRHRLVILALLRAAPPSVADPRRGDRGRAVRLCGVPARDAQAAALARRPHVPRHPPLDRHAARRSLRGDGAARASRRRRARLPQAAALTALSRPRAGGRNPARRGPPSPCRRARSAPASSSCRWSRSRPASRRCRGRTAR